MTTISRSWGSPLACCRVEKSRSFAYHPQAEERLVPLSLRMTPSSYNKASLDSPCMVICGGFSGLLGELWRFGIAGIFLRLQGRHQRHRWLLQRAQARRRVAGGLLLL